MGPGGPPGLQNRVRPVKNGLGGFDSHVLPLYKYNNNSMLGVQVWVGMSLILSLFSGQRVKGIPTPALASSKSVLDKIIQDFKGVTRSVKFPNKRKIKIPS
jgi:hypothetical protein